MSEAKSAPAAPPASAGAPASGQGGGARKAQRAGRDADVVQLGATSDAISRAEPQPGQAATAREAAPRPVRAQSRQEQPTPPRSVEVLGGDVEALRVKLVQTLRDSPVMTIDEETRFREAVTRGDTKGAAVVQSESTRRLERDVKSVGRMDAGTVRELDGLMTGPASAQARPEVRKLLDRASVRIGDARPPMRGVEVGRVSEARERGVQTDAPAASRAPAGELDAGPRRDARSEWEERQASALNRLSERFVRDGNQYGYGGRVAFVDEGKAIAAYDTTARTAQGVVDLAERKGWREVHVQGNSEFQRQVWIEGARRGLNVRAAEYQPTQPELAAAQTLSEPAAVVSEKNRARDGRTLPERSTSAGARLVAYGAAPYEFKQGADRNFYVTTERDGEKRVTWGKDLERAIKAADAQVGDRIKLDRVGAEPVQVSTVREGPDGTRMPVTVDAKRASWNVEVVERGQREVAQTPVQATVQKILRDAGATQANIDRALRVAAIKEQQLAQNGRALDVKGVDPKAPRELPIATVRVQEQAAPTRAR